MKIVNIRTFVPSKDFEVSKQFYKDLGFDLQWYDDQLAIFGSKTQNFFLQNYYSKEWAENFMMQIHVEDLDEAFSLAESLTHKYKDTKINDIFEAGYGRTFHLIGPAGELWHFTEEQVWE